MKTKLRNMDLLVASAFICNVLFALCNPVIHVELISSVSSSLVSISSLAGSIGSALVSRIWMKKGKELFKFYPIFLIIEPIIYGIAIGMVILNIMPNQVYYVLDALMYATVTNNIVCGGSRFKAIKYNNEDSRSNFDNSIGFYASIASIIGYSIGSIVTFNITCAFIMIFFSISIDNVLYFVEYRRLIKNKNIK